MWEYILDKWGFYFKFQWLQIETLQKYTFCLKLQLLLLENQLSKVKSGLNTKKTYTKSSISLLFVIRLGFEPRTPTLKVLCSTS